MSKKFDELRKGMSPEAQERAAARAKEMLAELPVKGSAIVNAAPKVIGLGITTEHVVRPMSVNRRRYEEALSYVRTEEDRYKFPFYEPVGTFSLLLHRVDFITGEHETKAYTAYFSIKGMICVRPRFGHVPFSWLNPDSLGHYRFRVTKNRAYGEMWSIGEPAHLAHFYKMVSKHLLRRNFNIYPHPNAILWPDRDSIENALMEYGYPANTRNAARAGWNACAKFYKRVLRALNTNGFHKLRLGDDPGPPITAIIPGIQPVRKTD